MAMTLGRREYSEAEMMRMQRDAEERVREMQSRARITVESDSMNSSQMRNRNWNNGNGMRRPNNRRPNLEPQQSQNHQNNPPQNQHIPPEPECPPPPDENCDEPKKDTTIIEDVMGALKLDEDYLLIVGLMLILINQRADTTLILALAYLLI